MGCSPESRKSEQKMRRSSQRPHGGTPWSICVIVKTKVLTSFRNLQPMVQEQGLPGPPRDTGAWN